MKYRLIGENNYMQPVDTILQNRGINDFEAFLKPKANCIIHYSKLNNINKAVETLIKHIEKGGELFIQVDSDP